MIKPTVYHQLLYHVVLWSDCVIVVTVQTERDYVISLSLVVNHYIPELKREDVPQALRGKRAIIFGNIEKIFEFHSNYFLEELSRCENEPYKISQCFLSHVSKLCNVTR